MPHLRSVRRGVLLALSLLSACAASDPTPGGGARSARYTPTGVFGNYLVGRFAMAEADPNSAATAFLKALGRSPGDPDLLQQAFIACLAADRPEAVQLARELPDNQVAQLLLGDTEAKAGNWQAAEKRFHALPRQGMAQLLQPLLIAWVQQGDGRTDAALATLRPYIDGQQFRGLFALHGAMIADLSKRDAEAARLYRIAQTGLPDINLRVAQILASWQARTGHATEAKLSLEALSKAAPDVDISVPALTAAVRSQPVARATDGIAEAYLTLAAALRTQESSEFARDFSMVMVRLALDLRPDFAAARLLASEVQLAQRHPENALQLLNGVSATDPVIALVRLRQAMILDRLDRSDEARHDLERLARENPNSPQPYSQLGDLLRLHSEFPEAIAAYDQAASRLKEPQRGDWVLFYNRGIAHERAHDWQKAEADLRRALELAPDQPFVLNYLGYSWADMGHNLDRAHQMILKAAERRPNDGAITDSLGWVLFRQGDIAEAVKTLERAVELDPEDATINGHLGDAYWAAGRKIEAQYQWRRALTLNPGADDAAKLEAKLNTHPAGSVVSGQ